MKMLSSFIGAAMVALPLLAAETPNPPAPVNLQVGQEFVIVLDGNPTTGYLWELAGEMPADAAVSVNLTCEPEESAEMFFCGAPSPTKLTITGKKPGEATVQLVYRRPWEKDKPAVAEKTFSVTVTPAGN